jgi:cell division protein FtsX
MTKTSPQILIFIRLILKEQKRATDAEERARRLAAVHEERVANLEARLAELSETVGNYDRLRQQDQMAIQKLKVRKSYRVKVHRITSSIAILSTTEIYYAVVQFYPISHKSNIVPVTEH